MYVDLLLMLQCVEMPNCSLKPPILETLTMEPPGNHLYNLSLHAVHRASQVDTQGALPLVVVHTVHIVLPHISTKREEQRVWRGLWSRAILQSNTYEEARASERQSPK
jgi:hypothetical protein